MKEGACPSIRKAPSKFTIKKFGTSSGYKTNLTSYQPLLLLFQLSK